MLPTVANTDTGAMDAGRLLETARRAEAAGLDGVYAGDHLLHPGPIIESVVALSAVAAVTRRISIGTCVMLIALRDPLWLTKQLGTLDAFAPGRIRFGVGLGGEYADEFAAVSVPLADRVAKLEAVLAAVKSQSLRERVTLPTGEESTLMLAPRPRPDMPVIFGGSKKAALERAARLGDGWVGFLLSPKGFAERRSHLLEQRARVGGGSFTCGMLASVHISSGPAPHAEASRAMSRIIKRDITMPPEVLAAGEPAAVAEQLGAYLDAGCEELLLALAEQGDGYARQLDLFEQEVLPRLALIRPAS
jgi:alkanesulfonate monooxygenase SsuD/methylene tetrahydromethanopterin reductase-like flavin-dependent oxidoreductase (luciferase family)